MASLNFSFPHPVYGNRDDVSGSKIEPKFTYSISDEQLTLNATGLLIEDPDISKLLSSGEASWQIRIQCPRTYLRLNFLSTGPDWSCNLSGKDFDGNVGIETRIIAKSKIEDYQLTNAHSDYEGFKFTLPAGEILAIGPTYSFFVDKSYDPLKAPVGSLFKVQEGSHDEGPYEVVLDDNEFIYIKLSKHDWSEYPGVRDRLPQIIHSAIVLPVLARAIGEMRSRSRLKWSERLQNLIRTYEIDPVDPLRAAQLLLASPISRTIREVNVYLDKQEIV